MAPEFRVLSLDGGGLRGIFTLRLLQEIEAQCGLPIQECFDYVVGTSTGGLIALAIFHCGMSIPECMELYREMGGSAFQKWKLGAGRAHAFDHTKLEALLLEKFGDRRMDEARGTKVAVVSHRWDQSPNRLAIFANYDLDPSRSRFERAPLGCFVREAARATSAAPTYFEPCAIDCDGVRRQYVDGGLVANDPVLISFAEASTLGVVRSVVSLGTGRLPVEVRPRDPNPWLWTLAHDLVEGSLEASANIQAGVATSIFEYLAIPFLRLDGAVLSNAMEDASKMSSWVAAAEAILAEKPTKRAIRDFCLENVLLAVPDDALLATARPTAAAAAAAAPQAAISPKRPQARPAAKLPDLCSPRAPLAANASPRASPRPTKRTPRRQAARWDDASSSSDEENRAEDRRVRARRD